MAGLMRCDCNLWPQPSQVPYIPEFYDLILYCYIRKIFHRQVCQAQPAARPLPASLPEPRASQPDPYQQVCQAQPAARPLPASLPEPRASQPDLQPASLPEPRASQPDPQPASLPEPKPAARPLPGPKPAARPLPRSTSQGTKGPKTRFLASVFTFLFGLDRQGKSSARPLPSRSARAHLILPDLFSQARPPDLASCQTHDRARRATPRYLYKLPIRAIAWGQAAFFFFVGRLLRNGLFL
ncbi:hypothetical protein CDD82_2763 [Ophiocordyceps australis]|uniref:Uncharacterized protein n=1 Tax=Ophiocordyceps australis TaxID=1399860 RepID=A0A2C5XTK7_9HYPO|nr:hypothetical protein CDD82_2763 [Ophiocordyceps australis]